MTINNRVELIINELKLNNNSFSKTIGVNPTVIHNICKGRNAPGFELLNKIVLTFDNINAHWLLTGEGSMLKSHEPEIQVKEPEVQYNKVCMCCSEKERVIRAQQQTIDILERELHHSKALYDDEREKGHNSDGQKRKVG